MIYIGSLIDPLNNALFLRTKFKKIKKIKIKTIIK
jgi:hypothetical protein